MNQQAADPQEPMESAVAVVGLSARLPGARNVAEFWANLRDGRESVTALSDEQLRRAGVPQALIDDPAYVKACPALADVEKFDAGFFGFSPLDASIMDPQHRHFLECCWEALESAGYDPAGFPGAIGVYAGSGQNVYLSRNLMTNPELVDQVGAFLLRHTGNDKDFLSTRVSYEFDLTGPSVNVQTACSTSLVAVHWACQSLLSGECDMALAGGVTIEMPPGRGYLAREGEILSPDGHCRPFDARANGTLFGSGVGVVVLRRLCDAIEDRDCIHAVIRGSAINNDGSGKIGYLAPSVDGQARAIAEALEIAGVEPASIGMLAAHGTGTAVGDPIEVAALAQAFGTLGRRGSCALGSVKSNIGHTDTAAGVASLIGAICALKHHQIPPTLHFERANPEIDFAATPFFVNAELRDWPASDVPRRAGVSSLGVGGTNAHVVVEEFDAPEPAPTARAAQLLPLSARSEAALDNATDRLADHLRGHPDLALADVAHTLQVGRRAFDVRRVVVGTSATAAVDRLESRAGFTGRPLHDRLSVAFMFPGGGAQYPDMGRELYETEPVYRDSLDRLFDGVDPDSTRQLRSLLFPDPADRERAARELHRPSLQLPLIFATEYALAQWWMSWGVRPDALIGHSMGENTAACVAGVFQPRDAMALVCLRGRLFERIPAGGMLSIPLAAEEFQDLLGPDLCLASINAPQLCVASGPRAAVDALARALDARDVETQAIRIDVAAHSAMLDPILGEWSAFLEKLELRAPQIPFISNLSGAWITDEEATDPRYWVRHLRSAVRFGDGVRLLLGLPERALLEVGPGAALTSLASLQAGPGRVVANSMRQPDDTSSDVAFALGALGRLWVGGLAVDWSALHAEELRRRVELPTYPFEHQRYWIEPGAALHEEGASSGPQRQPDLSDWFYAPTWRSSPRPTPSGLPRVALVLGAEPQWSGPLLEKLEVEGCDSVGVRPGAQFERTSRDRFVVRPANADDFERVFEVLAAEGRAPDAIAHLWNLAAPPADDCAGMLAHYAEARDLGHSSLTAIAQAIAARDLPDAKLMVVTRGAQQLAGEVPSTPLGALSIGACGVIANEIAGLRCVSVDLEPTGPAVSVAHQIDQLVRELAGRSDDAVVALRGDRRLVRGFDHVALGPANAASPLRECGVYLITGGLGGLGGALARHLGERFRARLVLLGRRPFPPRARWADWLETRPETDPVRRQIVDVQAIEAAGGEVLPVSADVCDAARLRAVVAQVREHFGALHGVIHAAGVLDDGLIGSRSAGAPERVLAAKVPGTLALHEATSDSDLDFFALYSSVSAVAGLPGQVDYAAASAFLDAFAGFRTARGGGATVSIGWGPWQQIGMTAQLARARPDDTRSTPLSHPFLECRLEPDGPTERFATDFSIERHWLVDEHRLASGDALIPGAGFLELAAAALTDRPEDRAIEIRDVFLETPFLVADDQARRLRMRFDRASGDFVLLSGSERAPVEHVRGTVRYLDEPLQSVDLSAIRARCGAHTRVFDGVPESVQLRFGPRWGCVRSVMFGDREALVELEMPPEFAGDLGALRLHPAMLDMATGCAHGLLPGFDPAREFCVPMSYSRVVSVAPLPARAFAHVRYRPDREDRDFAVLDVTLIDESGQLLVAFDGFVVKRIADASLLSASAAEVAEAAGELSDEASARIAARLRQAMRPAEGLEAFERILCALPLEHVIVLPQELSAWIADSHEPSPTAVAAGPAPHPGLLAEILETEQILSEHEAVARAAVTAHFDRPGQVRLLAHVVWEADRHATISELRRFLRGRLPDDRLPQNFVELESLPIDAEGNVRRDALDDPFGMADDFVEPRSETERSIAKVWRETLRIDRVGVYDNFFDIGGHSLLAMRAILKIENKLGVRLNNAIMVLQTLEQVAAECDKRAAAQPAPERAAEDDPDAPADARASLTTRLLRAVRGRGNPTGER